MRTSNRFSILFTISALSLALGALTACGKPSSQPENPATAIESTEGGEEIIAAEFQECETGELLPESPHQYVKYDTRYYDQQNLEARMPHQFRSIGQMYPNEGSWRRSKQEIMDIVDRYIADPDRGVVPMLAYFDMVLMINSAPRDSMAAANSSAQRLQIMVKQNNSNYLQDWKRIHTWPISTGVPCKTADGEKIATPTGVFKLDANRFFPDYYSEQFKQASMYESMFLYHKYQDGRMTGVALHGTYYTEALGRRDSGGCVRIYRDNAQCLYQTITGDRSNKCLDGGRVGYWSNDVLSVDPEYAEADPKLTSQGATWPGYRVLVVIFNDSEDLLN